MSIERKNEIEAFAEKSGLSFASAKECLKKSKPITMAMKLWQRYGIDESSDIH